MDRDVKLKIRSLARRAGLMDTPKPVLVCLGAVSILLLCFALWRFWPAGPASAGQDFQVSIGQGSSAQEAQDDSSQAGDASDVAQGKISVDVEGAVRHPGLYELDAGSRVGDAISAAGGMSKRAARGQVNLASVLEDGQQVVVPSKQDLASSGAQGSQAAKGSGSGSSGSSGGGAGGDAAGKININTASASELEQLSGIGESLSQRIIDYRMANGPFASVDELTNVSGIGDARLESIRAQICV